jgi:H+-transporting ATPase
LFVVLATQMMATIISVFGIFMTPITWLWALLVWAYAIFWFMINDRIKLMAYKILQLRLD